MSTGSDFIVSELLSELKSENERKDSLIKSMQRRSFIERIVFVSIVLLIVSSFLAYLSLYDFTSTTTMTTTAQGVYTLVDSEGNVIAQDLTPEEIQEVVNGYSQENSN